MSAGNCSNASHCIRDYARDYIRDCIRDCIRDLVRRDQEDQAKQRLRNLTEAGLASGDTTHMKVMFSTRSYK